jgi:1,4-dihydroxy-2-naphthoate octaprenyltransferase
MQQQQPMPATLEKKMVVLATIILLVGAAVLGLSGPVALGWVIVAYGLMTFAVAYLFSVAPYREDP